MASCPESPKTAQWREKLKESRYKLFQNLKKYQLYLPGPFTVIAKMILLDGTICDLSGAVVGRQNTNIKLLPFWTIFQYEDIGSMDKNTYQKKVPMQV